MAEYRTLEIKVKSAKDLNNVNLISKMETYVVVSIPGEPRMTQRTPVDRVGGKYPTWNSHMRFTVDESAARQNRLSVVFTLRCERALGDKDVGQVHVPVTDLLNSVDDGKQCHLAYQVRKPSGRPKGELSFSYQWGGKVAAAPPPVAEHFPGHASAPPQTPEGKTDEPVTAYPAAGTSFAYPAGPNAYGPYPPPHGGYGDSPPSYGGPPAPYGFYPPPPGPGYGYPGQRGYMYPPVQQPAPRRNSGLGLGAGLLGGALGGLLIGDMVSDAAFDC